MWSPARQGDLTINMHGGGGHVLGGGYPGYVPHSNVILGGGGGDGNANYDMLARLDDERRRFCEYKGQYRFNYFRAEDFRAQLENERSIKERLEDENDRLRREFDRYDREYKDRERTYQNQNKVAFF